MAAACFGIAGGHVEGGMVGDLCFMCPEFIQVGFQYNLVCIFGYAVDFQVGRRIDYGRSYS